MRNPRSTSRTLSQYLLEGQQDDSLRCEKFTANSRIDESTKLPVIIIFALHPVYLLEELVPSLA